jgi:hypothetical protein
MVCLGLRRQGVKGGFDPLWASSYLLPYSFLLGHLAVTSRLYNRFDPLDPVGPRRAFAGGHADLVRRRGSDPI